MTVTTSLKSASSLSLQSCQSLLLSCDSIKHNRLHPAREPNHCWLNRPSLHHASLQHWSLRYSQSIPLRSRASKAWATDKQVERNMIVCRRFSSFGACCAICSKEALQHIINKMVHQQPVQGLKQGCARGGHALQQKRNQGR